MTEYGMIFTASQLAMLDRAYLDLKQISTLQLIEIAGKNLFQTLKNISCFRSSRFVVLVGAGNNGADAMVLACCLKRSGKKVEVYLFWGKRVMADHCKQLRNELVEESIDLKMVDCETDIPSFEKDIIVIDGLLGTGVNRSVDGLISSVIHQLNQSSATVVSVDLPSGLSSDALLLPSQTLIVRADHTLAIAFPKWAFFLEEFQPFLGRVHLSDLFDSSFMPETYTTPKGRIITPRLLRSLLRRRSDYSSKRTFGHALLIAGSQGKAGAARLSAEAAMRSGLGMLTVHTAASCVPILQSSLPDAMCESDENLEWITSVASKSYYSAVAIGPGIGTNHQTANAVEGFIQQNTAPLVIDADGLNVLSLMSEPFSKIPAGTILTPHTREFDRLFGAHTSHHGRIEKAIEMAKTYQWVILLKSATPSVITLDGVVYMVDSPNSALANAGSGDVLTGIILGLLSQNYSPEEATLLAVGLHSLAGSFGRNELTSYSLLASDLCHYLPSAFREIGG